MKQWRLTWEMWPVGWDKPHVTEKIHDDENQAISQLEGLRKMLAPHPPQPCDKHVWNIKMETRETGEWIVQG